LAAQIPTDLDARLLSIGKSPALTNVLQAIDKVKALGTILPPIAIILLVASVFAGGDRRAATLRLGVGLFAWGIAGFLFLTLARAVAVDQVPNGVDRDAAGPVWDEVIGPFRVWLLVAAAIGLGLAALAYWRDRLVSRPYTPG
jgi:phosphatidylglycerophosphatase A